MTGTKELKQSKNARTLGRVYIYIYIYRFFYRRMLEAY